MPFKRPSLSEILARIRTGIFSRLTAEQLRRSDAEVYGNVLAGASHELHGHLQFIQAQVIYDSAEGEYLDRWASIWLTQPRKPAAPATGSIRFTGTNGSVIQAGTIVVRSDGLEYTTAAEVTIAAGFAVAVITASEPGDLGNTMSDTMMNLAGAITGVASAATVEPDGITGGSNQEDDASLRARLRDRIRQPPHGGAEYDYINWALQYPGVTRAWVYPNALGLGTVTVRFVRDNDPDIIPDSTEVEALQAYLDDLRPVTAGLTVVAPVAVPLDFEISVVPNSAEVRAAVESELRDLLKRESEPGGTILLSHIREAISISLGERDHQLTQPVADVTHGVGQMAVFGTIEWV